MVTGSLGSEKMGTSGEAGVARRSGKPRSWSQAPELQGLVGVERAEGSSMRAKQGPCARGTKDMGAM